MKINRRFKGVLLLAGISIISLDIFLIQILEIFSVTSGGPKLSLDDHLITTYGYPLKHQFDIPNGDLLVFLHIQKTGGSSFNSHIVRFLEAGSHSCNCINPEPYTNECFCPNGMGAQWFIGRFNDCGACGGHATWDMYKTCLPRMKQRLARKYKKDTAVDHLMFTILREPVSRYISEWNHVKKGARWMTDSRLCADSQSNCETFSQDISLSEFSICSGNLANNRQTRMLADLKSLNCSTTKPSKATKQIMLQSAKINLSKLSMFGLNEHFYASQLLFSRNFGMTFKKDIKFRKGSSAHGKNITTKDLELIREANQYDIQLYEFAQKLFYKRLKYMISEDKNTNRSSVLRSNYEFLFQESQM